MTTWLVIGSLAAIAGPFVLYPLALWLRALLAPDPVRARDCTPSVSLIICAHNEAASIESKLRGALALDYPAALLEIIVASDGSTDATVEIAERVLDGARSRALVLDLPRGGKASALNHAVGQARSDILAFSDANSEWPTDALRALVRPFADERVGGVAGDQRYRRAPGSAAGERGYWRFDRALKRWQDAAGSAISATGAIHAIRRSLFQTVPDDATDDFMVSTGAIAQGYRLAFARDAVALEDPATHHAGEFRRKVRVITRGLRAVAYRRALLDPTRYGSYSLLLFIHKLWRRLTWIPLALLVLSAPAAMAAGGWLGWVAAGVCLCVAVGGFGLLVPAAGRHKPFALAAYVLMVNAACAIASVNALRGHRVSRWDPERAAEGPAS